MVTKKGQAEQPSALPGGLAIALRLAHPVILERDPDTYLSRVRATMRGSQVDDVDRRAVIDGWFRSYADRVLAYLLHRTDPQTAQDLLQEVFVIAFRKAAQVPDPPLGWLFGTSRRLLANRYRGHRRQDELIARLLEDAGRESDPDTAELKAAFGETLANLSAADREVLTLTGWVRTDSDRSG